jgi:hypothetical protein
MSQRNCDELRQVCAAAAKANELAAAGRAGDGYELLLVSRHAARERRRRDAPGASPVLACWDELVEEFARYYSIPRE